MGYQHGVAYRDDIRHLAQDRVRLCRDPNWSGVEMTRSEIIVLANKCLDAHKVYSPDGIAELQGMSDATGVDLPELLILNGFTDFVDLVHRVGSKTKPKPLAIDDCTAFIVPNSISHNKQGFLGQTWDMHDTATPYVILLDGKPKDAPNFLAFTIAGCVGMIGMNEVGLAVGINNLVGEDAEVGVTWTFVIREILKHDTVESALDCITKTTLAGAHNYLLLDRHGNGYNVEAMTSTHHITKLEDTPIAHTNHCLTPKTQAVERERPSESLQNSVQRLRVARNTLEKQAIYTDDLLTMMKEVPICTTATPPTHIETCGAALMRPTTGDFWATWGKPNENEYEHFNLTSSMLH